MKSEKHPKIGAFLTKVSKDIEWAFKQDIPAHEVAASLTFLSIAIGFHRDVSAENQLKAFEKTLSELYKSTEETNE